MFLIMSISIVVQIILAIAKAFPIVDKWLDQLYNEKIARAKVENRESIKDGIENQDQRRIEDAMGSTKTGEISGIPNAEIVDKLPGVK